MHPELQEHSKGPHALECSLLNGPLWKSFFKCLQYLTACMFKQAKLYCQTGPQWIERVYTHLKKCWHKSVFYHHGQNRWWCRAKCYLATSTFWHLEWPLFSKVFSRVKEKVQVTSVYTAHYLHELTVNWNQIKHLKGDCLTLLVPQCAQYCCHLVSCERPSHRWWEHVTMIQLLKSALRQLRPTRIKPGLLPPPVSPLLPPPARTLT